MTDIVERLREWEAEGRWRGNKDLYGTLEKARDEIERLRAALHAVRNEINSAADEVAEIAREALGHE